MWTSREDYSVQDSMGRWINTEFPPVSYEKYYSYEGYKNMNQSMLYYWFAVMYYDARIKYKGNDMILYADEEIGCCVTDGDRNEISNYYPTANDLINNFRFSDGKSLIEVVDSKDFDIDFL